MSAFVNAAALIAQLVFQELHRGVISGDSDGMQGPLGHSNRASSQSHSWRAPWGAVAEWGEQKRLTIREMNTPRCLLLSLLHSS